MIPPHSIIQNEVLVPEHVRVQGIASHTCWTPAHTPFPKAECFGPQRVFSRAFSPVTDGIGRGPLPFCSGSHCLSPLCRVLLLGWQCELWTTVPGVYSLRASQGQALGQSVLSSWLRGFQAGSPVSCVLSA